MRDLFFSGNLGKELSLFLFPDNAGSQVFCTEYAPQAPSEHAPGIPGRRIPRTTRHRSRKAFDLSLSGFRVMALTRYPFDSN
jgi:hypothetical protein